MITSSAPPPRRGLERTHCSRWTSPPCSFLLRHPLPTLLSHYSSSIKCPSLPPSQTALLALPSSLPTLAPSFQNSPLFPSLPPTSLSPPHIPSLPPLPPSPNPLPGPPPSHHPLPPLPLLRRRWVLRWPPPSPLLPCPALAPPTECTSLRCTSLLITRSRTRAYTRLAPAPIPSMPPRASSRSRRWPRGNPAPREGRGWERRVRERVEEERMSGGEGEWGLEGN